MFNAHCVTVCEMPLNKSKHVMCKSCKTLSNLSLLLRPGTYLFSFIFLFYVMTCVLFVIHTLSVYNGLLGCLYRLQNKENGSEPS